MINKITDFLKLPESCMVNTKLTKAFFKRNFELTLSERKLLDDFAIVVSLDLIASVKTTTSNVPVFSDDQMPYLEILVIAVQTSNDEFEKFKINIAELIQKYIPYPILLCVYSENEFILNTCTKRINQNDASKRTVESHYFTENISIASPTEKQQSFLKSLSFALLDKHNLKTLYDSYTSRIIALCITDVTGIFTVHRNERSKQDVLLIQKIADLGSEITSLLNQAKKESQLNIQIQLNNHVQP
jgi:hypothetical protein